MPSYELIIRINGTDAAFLPIFRHRQNRPKVCTSVSLFVFRDGTRVFHGLLDCGPGVGEAIQSPDAFPTPFPLDGFLLSHAHPDHFLGIDALLGDQHWWGRARGIEMPPLKVYGHPDTLRETIELYFPFRKPSVEFVECLPGVARPLWSDGAAELLVTQVEVVHYRHSVANLFTFRDEVVGDDPIRVACLFDFGRFHEPGSPEARAGGTAANPHFSRADLLITEATTWNDQRNTVGRVGKHQSFETLAQYLVPWKPRQTRIVHYSGCEDAAGAGFPSYLDRFDRGDRIHPSQGPAAEWELDDAIQRHMARLGYEDPRSVRVARPMETLVVSPRLEVEERRYMS